MEELIKNRIAIIVSIVIGSGSGFGMAQLIEASEIKTRLVIIAIASSLLISLLVSFYLKHKPKQKKLKAARRIIITAAIFFVLSIAAFFYSYDSLTLSYPLEDNKMKIVDTVIIVKGLYYKEPAKRYIEKTVKQSHIKLEDSQVLEAFNYKIDMIWTNTSITLSKLIILFLYTLLICSLITVVMTVPELIKPENKKPG